MAGLGVTLEIEAGPGKVLSGLVKRINKTIAGHEINDVAGLNEALAAANEE